MDQPLNNCNLSVLHGIHMLESRKGSKSIMDAIGVKYAHMQKISDYHSLTHTSMAYT